MEITPILSGSNVSVLPDAVSAGAGVQPSVYDVAGFRHAWHEAGPANSVSPQESPTPPGSVTESDGMRAVFSALDSLNGRAEKLETNSQIFTNGERDMTPGEMLMLTVQAHEFLFHAQLTANVANRTSDGIQQLFRQQS